MKRLLSYLILGSIFWCSLAQAEMQIDNSDIPLSVCVGQWGFIDASGEFNNFNWSTNAWGSQWSEAKNWSPDHVGIMIRSDEREGVFVFVLKNIRLIRGLDNFFDGAIILVRVRLVYCW